MRDYFRKIGKKSLLVRHVVDMNLFFFSDPSNSVTSFYFHNLPFCIARFIKVPSHNDEQSATNNEISLYSVAVYFLNVDNDNRLHIICGPTVVPKFCFDLLRNKLIFLTIIQSSYHIRRLQFISAI